MSVVDLQEQCELGQSQLMAMQYLAAEATLAAAEREAWTRRDWDSLARLYLPLQEARRQRRQRCGEGIVCLDLVAESPADAIDGRRILENFPHGQLLVAGWGTIRPALQVRSLQAELGLFVELFLAAAFPLTDGAVAVVVVPCADASLPSIEPRGREQLAGVLPAGALILNEDEIPRGSRRGNARTYGTVLALWERLHLPYLRAADIGLDPVQKMADYRRTIEVDYACELAHQKLSDVAREMPRNVRASTPPDSDYHVG